MTITDRIEVQKSEKLLNKVFRRQEGNLCNGIMINFDNKLGWTLRVVDGVLSVWCRHLAKIQFENDCKMVWVGTVCYLFAIKRMYTAPAPGGGLFPALVPLGLALESLWPNLFKYVYKETFFRWRDELFTIQWVNFSFDYLNKCLYPMLNSYNSPFCNAVTTFIMFWDHQFFRLQALIFKSFAVLHLSDTS